MERFNVPIPPDEDFPQVIRAQRSGEDFKTEYVEYVPRWKLDRSRNVVVVNKAFFQTLVESVDKLQGDIATLRVLALFSLPALDKCDMKILADATRRILGIEGSDA